MTKKSAAGKPVKKILKIIAVVLAFLIALYCVYYLAAIMITGDQLPMPFGMGVAVVLTGSMEDTLSANDLIFVAAKSDYEIGDIVVYSTGGTPVVHRIVEYNRETGTIVTKGDANNTADAPIPLSKVKGRVAFAIPYVGIIPRFIRTVPGMIMVLALLFVLLFLSLHTKSIQRQEDDRTQQLEAEIARLKSMIGAEDEDAAEDCLHSAAEAETESLKPYSGENAVKDSETNNEP